MGMPAIVTASGTSNATTATVWFADWMQNPFSVSFMCVPSSGTGYSVEYTMDNIDVSNINTGLGKSLASATWLQSSVTATSAITAGNIASPVRALRANCITAASAASTVTVTFMQATFGR